MVVVYDVDWCLLGRLRRSGDIDEVFLLGQGTFEYLENISTPLYHHNAHILGNRRYSHKHNSTGNKRDYGRWAGSSLRFLKFHVGIILCFGVLKVDYSDDAKPM